MDVITSFVFSALFAAVGFGILYWVVREAVLSALRTHHAELSAPAPTPTHLDADGM